jgi:hypothetical protein
MGPHVVTGVGTASHAPPVLTKLSAWDAPLALYLEAWRGKPFEWGTWDCGHLVAGTLAIMTGASLDLILAGVPKYSSEFGGIRAVRSLGHGLMEGRLRSLGLVDVDGGLVYAQRGDIVVADRGGFLDALGVIWTGTVWTTHPGSHCQPYPIAELLSDAIVLRVP